jgi:hypothetical protein
MNFRSTQTRQNDTYRNAETVQMNGATSAFADEIALKRWKHELNTIIVLGADETSDRFNDEN